MNNNSNSKSSEWERVFDPKSQRIYYVNHELRTTQWLNPMDQFTQPTSFAECVGNQLPYGWEKINDPKIGIYYINHLEQKNQFNDPRVEWQNKRLQMLNNYLQRASNNIQIHRMKGAEHHKSCLSSNQSIDVVKTRVTQLKEDLDSNDKFLEVMDRWYKKGSNHGVEV